VFEEVYVLFHFNIIPNTTECPLLKKIYATCFYHVCWRVRGNVLSKRQSPTFTNV